MNGDMLEDVYNAALNADGSAMQENEKYLESLEAKTVSFTNSLHELAVTSADTDFLKGLVETGTGFLNILTELIDKFGIFQTLAVTGGTVAGFKNKGEGKMQPFTSNVKIALNNMCSLGY